MTYYIYHIPGIKIGATKNLKSRLRYNFRKYQIEPIVIETIEGPDIEEFWQVVGDREWELADLYGYDRGDHYRVIRKKPKKEAQVRAGSTKKPWLSISNKQKRTLTKEQVLEVKALLKTGMYQHIIAEKIGCTRHTIMNIKSGKYYKDIK